MVLDGCQTHTEFFETMSDSEVCKPTQYAEAQQMKNDFMEPIEDDLIFNCEEDNPPCTGDTESIDVRLAFAALRTAVTEKFTEASMTIDLEGCVDVTCISRRARAAIDEQLVPEITLSCFELYGESPNQDQVTASGCIEQCLDLTYSFDCNPLYVFTKRDETVPFEGDCASGGNPCEEYVFKNKTGIAGFDGQFGSYLPGGFVIDFRADKQANIDRLNLLRENGWINENTRVVQIVFTIKNAWNNLIYQFRIMIEFPTGP